MLKSGGCNSQNNCLFPGLKLLAELNYLARVHLHGRIDKSAGHISTPVAAALNIEC
jgi:hypothetical protein